MRVCKQLGITVVVVCNCVPFCYKVSEASGVSRLAYVSF